MGGQTGGGGWWAVGGMCGEGGRSSPALGESGDEDGGGRARCGAHRTRFWQRARGFDVVGRHRNVGLRGRGAGGGGRGSHAGKAGQAGRGRRVRDASARGRAMQEGRAGATRGREQERKRSGGKRAILRKRWAGGQRQAAKQAGDAATKRASEEWRRRWTAVPPRAGPTGQPPLLDRPGSVNRAKR